MSLLPEFNEKFDTAIRKRIVGYDIFNDCDFGKVTLIDLTIRAMKDLLNPDLNPLTFEEVKGWFDRKAKSGECVYHGEYLSGSHKGSCHWFEIFWARHYYIYQDGYAKQLLSETLIPFSNLLNELSDNPLYTFCQMKGYVNI